jgi:hypothetical protein
MLCIGVLKVCKLFYTTATITSGYWFGSSMTGNE